MQADKNAENVQIVRFSSAKVDFFGFCPEKSACYIDETGKKRYNKCMCAMRNESFMQGTNFVFRQKGGSAVKHVGRAVFFACLTALLLLGMRQLVVAPESASAESSPAPPGIPAVMTAALPAPESAAASASTAQEALHRPAALPAHPPMPVLTRADGCGWLITGRSYVRTVYIAFHLEGSAG